jgi:hopanoid biosynthesis associated protein HpnK
VVRRVIINADDFGLTRGVNRAIAEAHAHGVVTSSTLMALGPGFEDAVAVTRAHPSLSVGCHVMLLDGALLSDKSTIPTLLAGDDRTQPAYRRLGRFVVRALRGQLSHRELRSEITAQITKLQRAGIPVSHVDTHLHTHIFPAIFKPLLEAASECGVRAVRNPFGPLKPMAFAHLMRRPRLWTRYSEVGLLRGFAAGFRKEVAAAGMTTTDGSFGIVGTGMLDERLFEAIIGCMPEGSWEFVCHPGYCDAELLERGGRLRKSREQELRILTSQRAREVLGQHGVELISYRQLLATSC